MTHKQYATHGMTRPTLFLALTARGTPLAGHEIYHGAVHKHEKALHPGKPMTKFAKGGKTGEDMMKYGRGMAKVMNQKSGRGG